MKQAESSTGGTPSDAELILQVRSGDRDAFGVLYERHAAAARALARQYVSPTDAEDVVADAFSKLFEMLRRGAGPDAGFRPYLYTVVRHRAFDVSRGAARTRPSTDDEIESVLGRVASEEDPALAGFERSVIYKAYADLPERWREVLWYVLVDDVKPAQVAPVLGLSPNGVSALLYRAKEALRAGYLQQHLTHAPSDTCRSVNPLLGGYVRESLSKRETTKITEHLATCGTCNALVLELHDVAHGMKTVIAPLVLGAGGLALVGAGAPIGGLAIAAKAGAGAGAAAGAPATVGVGAASAGTFSGAVSSAVSATAGAIASAAAAATGGSVAAGALAAAAVGVVAALQIAGPPEPEPIAADQVITTTEGRELPGSEEINGKPVLPTDVGPGDTTTSNYLVVDYDDASKPLAPRQPQDLTLSVENTGEATATGTQLEIHLPAGLTVARPEGPFGTGVGGRLVPASVETPEDSAGNANGAEDGGAQIVTPSPEASADAGPAKSAESGGAPDAAGEATAEPTSPPSEPSTVGPVAGDGPSACTPTEQTNVLLCSLGELAPGQKHNVTVRVQANFGGDYPVGTEVWADGLEHVARTLPGRTVAPFGPELSAATADVSLSSPGVAALPVRVASTGDRAVPAGGWAVDVTLPDGVTPAVSQPELTCAPGAMPNAWRCAPLAGTDAAAVELAPQATAEVALNITTATAAPSSSATVLGAANVRPVLEGNAHSASATLVVTSAWANAADGVGTVAASCEAEGGAAVADSVVTGTYTNTTQHEVRATLEAAGSKASSGTLAPGESTTLTVHDGLRVPAGQATFVLATDVDGRPYETRVPAGPHERAGCYVPKWTTDTSARTFNSGGTVAVEGTLKNTSDEMMNAVMSVPVGDSTMESVSRVVPPGGVVNFTVNTGRTELAAGEATFRLTRDGVDEDGDPPMRAVVPETNPKAAFEGATIDPAQGSESMASGVCEFNAEQDRSVQMFSVMADNTGSTLPVLFHVGDISRTVQPRESMRIDFPVAWGTETVDLRAAGKTLAKLKVPFESCAELKWPAEAVTVTTAAQCVDDWHVQHTAAVENRTGRDWMGVLVREGSGEVGPEKQVGAGTTTLEVTRNTPISGEGNVTVRLTRQLEGEAHTVDRSFPGGSMTCPDGGEEVVGGEDPDVGGDKADGTEEADGTGEVCEPTSAATTPASSDPSDGGWLAPWLPGYCGD
ncbi:sigma-70 family RNA polymerase sigma factor [Promicromonospora panici]|uniref:sigma-70 family RNA polymerase sigma factor n=1 Tax=Promicromonospora panici TaxID=2219658 RepID=UPI00101D2BBB|nr:sigma-70 family RNA polymerase sigma factor [Promicromonospora panici]